MPRVQHRRLNATESRARPFVRALSCSMPSTMKSQPIFVPQALYALRLLTAHDLPRPITRTGLVFLIGAAGRRQQLAVPRTGEVP